ncbi:hypothetical protein PGTUg99_005286 [Puccinia graminis f. sp. tritici]|uniref:Uncharacterized protein n=1 Tax=Puccinia graminis f. sp. tritici TaxID=56615 RepID=A0A5B0NI85_PUCGR|nr:hypothetical protein PGTUg99_005286 [Puccinia graminis f. sp. tritici]
MHHRFPQPACVASAPRAFRISATSILRAPKQTGQSFGPVRSHHHIDVPYDQPGRAFPTPYKPFLEQ